MSSIMVHKTIMTSNKNHRPNIDTILIESAKWTIYLKVP
jgi:hypothetical protein